MEVNTGADKHPQPKDHDEIQGNVEQVEPRPEQRGVAGGLHQSHGGRLLHDQQGGVAEDEAVSRDVKAVPVEAGSPTRRFRYELLHGDVTGRCLEARASHLLNVEEGAGADVPDGCGDGHRQQAAAEEVNAAAGGEVKEDDEGREQQQRPSPRQFDHVPAKRHMSSTSVVFNCFKSMFFILLLFLIVLFFL